MRYQPAVGHVRLPSRRIWAELVSGNWNEGVAYACEDCPEDDVQKHDLMEFSMGTDGTWPIFVRRLERGQRRHVVRYPAWDDDAADWWKS